MVVGFDPLDSDAPEVSRRRVELTSRGQTVLDSPERCVAILAVGSEDVDDVLATARTLAPSYLAVAKVSELREQALPGDRSRPTVSLAAPSLPEEKAVSLDAP